MNGRPREQKTWNGTGARRLHRHKQYYWHPNDRLQRIHDVLTDTATRFRHDSFGNLIESLTVQEYRIQGKENYFRDEVGNIFREEEKKDRKYGAGGKLLENKGDKYSYDEEGNLIQKTTKEGNWIYEWNGNGSLKQVTRPDNKTVSFEYDALGRRTAKIYDGKITRWLWDGNVPLNEWKYDLEDRPKDVVDEFGFISKDREEPVENLVTWVFDDGSFKPAAKIVDGEYYSIINDYLGTPKEAYDKYSDCVWKCEHEVYGKVKSCEGEVGFIPFRFQGQYHDVETGLYYNRFRYYAPDEAMYVSQDPIGLEGGDRLYNYVYDPNCRIDVLGWVDIWYRALSQADINSLNSGNGKIPKDPFANNSPLEHVLHGSTDGYNDQYISLTKEKAFAERWARKSGTEVVKIDLDQVPNSKLDLTTSAGRVTHLGNAGLGDPDIVKANKFAKNAAELLVEGNIPQAAIVDRYKPKCH
ncbi:RHS repeat-associated core domain-containing protein [Cytophagaceae bacterium ABcell3]|nr:RHS repeat-associated core domain-containing protein [Cytophagaceae bacterium ABcell3]